MGLLRGTGRWRPLMDEHNRTSRPVRLGSRDGSTHRRAERADAARNRARVLDAAGAAVRGRGGAPVTMEQVAAAAGVGKATLYRRYPDVASIAVALLDEHERALQERLLRGAAAARARARRRPSGSRRSTRAMVDLLERHGHLALAAETGARRFATGAYRAWALHVGALLATRRACDAGARAGRRAARPARARRSTPTSARRALRPRAIADALATLARARARLNAPRSGRRVAARGHRPAGRPPRRGARRCRSSRRARSRCGSRGAQRGVVRAERDGIALVELLRLVELRVALGRRVRAQAADPVAPRAALPRARPRSATGARS